MPENRPTMISIYMAFAELLSKRSTCSRLQVGAVITSSDFENVYSVGYNGSAKGQYNQCESDVPGECGHIHAEENALIKCYVKDPNKILFVTNLPCPMCAKKLVNSGFSRVFFKNDYRNHRALDILKEAGIYCEQI